MVEKSHTSGFWPSLYEPMRQAGQRLADWIAPASEASSSQDAYRVAVELPGVAEEDIEVTATQGMLTLKGEKKTERSVEGDSWFFSERQYGAFARSFRLPPDADTDKIRADLKDGVLQLTIPKKAPATAEGGSRIKINRG